MTDWQDIKTAPKDGTEIILCYEAEGGPLVAAGWWSKTGADLLPQPGSQPGWFSALGSYFPGPTVLTHWQPMPDPPYILVPGDD